MTKRLPNKSEYIKQLIFIYGFTSVMLLTISILAFIGLVSFSKDGNDLFTSICFVVWGITFPLFIFKPNKVKYIKHRLVIDKNKYLN